LKYGIPTRGWNKRFTPEGGIAWGEAEKVQPKLLKGKKNLGYPDKGPVYKSAHSAWCSRRL